MTTIKIEISSQDQAVHLCTIADNFLDDIAYMQGTNNKNERESLYLAELKYIWEQISKESLKAISEIDEGEK